MPILRFLSDHTLIKNSYLLRRKALWGSSAVMPEVRRLEAELRRRFSNENWQVSGSDRNADTVRSSPVTEISTLTEATGKFIGATADPTASHGIALHDLLRNLRTVLHMDFAFVAEFVNDRKIYREIDRSDGSTVSLELGASEALEATLSQRIVNRRAPQIMRDTRSDSTLRDLPAVRALDIGAYVSAPIILRSGRVYGNLCCISHQAREALDSLQLDHLRYVAGIIAAKLDERRN